jgi:F5/8 type C domain
VDFWTGLYFYPYPDTIAYSEHLLGIAIFTAPVQWLTANPILAFNLAMMGSTALAGAGMYALVRELTGRADAAFIAGVAFACSPYRVAQASHLQVLVSGWMPIALCALHRFLATRSTRALALFVLAFVIQAYSNGYFLYFLAVPVTITAVHGLWRRRSDIVQLLPRLAGAAIAILAALAPVAWAYVRVRREQGPSRTPGDLLQFSPDLSAYGHVSQTVWAWRNLLPIGRHEQELFPGLTVILLAAGAAWYAARAGRPSASSRGLPPSAVSDSRLYLFILAVTLLLSLGPRPSVFGWHIPFPGPYAWLSAVVPGMDGLRVPARMATVVHLALVALAGVGFAVLTARRSGRFRAVLAAVAAVLIACEGYGGRLPVEAFPTADMSADAPAYMWLRTQPRGPALELPVGGADVAARHLYRTLTHGNRIVNGYSGSGSALQDFVGGPPFTEIARIDDALAMARALGVRWIIVHPPLYKDPASGAAIVEAVRGATAHVARVVSFEAAAIAELRPAALRTSLPVDPAWREVRPPAFAASASHNPGGLQRAFDGDRDSRWFTGERQLGREWIELRFHSALDVARVRLDMDRRSNGDYPRGLVAAGSEDGRTWRTLFEGGILPRLGLSIAREPRTPGIDLVLPPNTTRVLRLRTTGQTRVWYWSVHELRVWTR